jgi:hypothetical protein
MQLNEMLLDMFIRMRRSPTYQFTFVKGNTEGALLLLPDGASRSDLHRKAHFHQYAIRNGPSWYQFVNQNLGTKIPKGLILVTGCDMAHSWAVTSFHGIPPDVEGELTFSPSSSGRYSLETNFPSSVRTGHGALNQNQCVFIRGLVITARGTGILSAALKRVTISSIS